MKIQFGSDLHLECSRESSQPQVFFDDIDADVLVLAGDIDGYGEALAFANACAQRFAVPVLFVPGNHEYYHGSISLTNTSNRFTSHGVHCLDRQSLVIDDVRFLGCTLWTDFAVLNDSASSMREAGQWLADYRMIRNEGRLLTPADTLAFHQRDRAWLEAELDKPWAGPTVVITHHAPHPGSIADTYKDDLTTGAFVSDLASLMGGDRVAVWIHGHTHDSFDYDVRGTRVVCNPGGYPGEHRLYRRDRWIDAHHPARQLPTDPVQCFRPASEDW